ncbi:hypothetical protein BDD12DRAFT_872297 [Trichophaea hybrida]|nr:hypothetical protein BDD12DRAFT_872297 [Trichophaea hybrida]
MVEVTCSVIYSEISHFLRLCVPGSTTVGELKASAVHEMQKHMAEFVPGVQLEPAYSDFYPTACMSSSCAHPRLLDARCTEDEKRLDELTTTDPTIVVWPKSTDAGNPSPVTDTLQDFKQQALQANARANAAELIGSENDFSTLVLRELRKMGLGTLKADHEKIMAKNGKIEMGNKSLKEEVKGLQDTVLKIMAKNGEIEMENKSLKEEVKGLQDTVLKITAKNGEIEIENKSLKEEVKGLQEEVKCLQEGMKGLQDTALKNSIKQHNLALRKLLDSGRDKFAKHCNFTGWEDMKNDHGFTSAKQKMAAALRQDHAYDSKFATDAIVDLVTENNAFRARGNANAHDFDPQDILEAVQCLPNGKDRSMFSELYEFVYGS